MDLLSVRHFSTNTHLALTNKIYPLYPEMHQKFVKYDNWLKIQGFMLLSQTKCAYFLSRELWTKIDK